MPDSYPIAKPLGFGYWVPFAVVYALLQPYRLNPEHARAGKSYLDLRGAPWDVAYRWLYVAAMSRWTRQR
jgi:hypothetical protein